ncbi:hypothetical protein PK35_09060 [Tamlana nanhaiensis]|uniref:Uncharacterized protein n=1 Tax=Neotamlana nanhaiensis TaxID=1382798 RepID=A0A0D7W1T9_9FLAO|nr:hypothetical protein [Tamlana nanhaiensis]KJD33100.1 hypothetical protein PK35_09060 [Tamlana nanhaiensis]
MNAAELKLNLITKITSISDKKKLTELLQLINFQSDASEFITSNDEKQAISEAKIQIEKGDTYTNSQVQEEVLKWIKK